MDPASSDRERRDCGLDARVLTLGLGVGLVVAYAAWRIAIDLDPRSLWVDDAWVVALARAPGFGFFLVQPASAPPLFMALVGTGGAILPDPELGAQAWSFTAALLAVAAVGALGHRLTGSALCAVIAAAVVALDTGFVTYGARVKPYSSDVLAVAVQGLCFHALLSHYDRRRLWLYVGVTAVGFCVSTYSLLVAGATGPVLAVALWRRGIRDRALYAAGLSLAGSALMIGLRISGRARFDQLAAFWADHHLPTDDPWQFARAVLALSETWLTRLAHAGEPHVGPLPGDLVIVGVLGLLVLGLVEMATRGLRWELTAGASTLLAALVGSAGGHVPLGELRSDLYLLPFGAVLLASGVRWLSRGAANLGVRLPGPVGAEVLPPVFVLCMLGVQAVEARVPRYPDEPAAPLVGLLEGAWREGDGLAVNLHGTYGLATYTSWALRFVDDGRMSIPHPEPIVDGFLIVDTEDPRYVTHTPDSRVRSWVFLCHDRPELRHALISTLTEAGYVVRREQVWPGCGLWLFERDG